MSDFMNGMGASFGQGGATSASDSTGLVFNLTGVDENKTGGFEAIPKGAYDAIIEACELTESKSSGAPMFSMTYAIAGGEYDGRKIFDYMVIGASTNGKDNSKAIEFGQSKLKKLLIRVCPEVNLAAFNAQSFADLGTPIGKQCRLLLDVRTQKTGDHKGEKQNSIKDILVPETNSFI